MKKFTALILAVILLMASAIPVFAAAPETVVPFLINTSQARVTFAVSADGTASWTIMCIGKSSCTGIDAVTYLERQVGNSWVRVDLGNLNDEYTYSTTGLQLVKNNKTTLTMSGTYRAVVVFTVYGTVEDETITAENEYYYTV